MFISPRFVVVDDDPIHAYAIAGCVQELGSSCATVIFTPDKDVPSEVFLGARVVFMDLQLLDKAAGDFKRHFAQIQRILGQVINPQGGPYMLVLWTDAPERAPELRAYLDLHLFSKVPHTKPLTLLALSKNEYIDSSTGLPTNSIELGLRIRADIDSVPPMAALLQWETDVLNATNGVLQTVLSAARVESGDVELGSVLKRMAIDASGERHALADPEAAIHLALAPLLQDQVQSAAATGSSGELWKRAFDGSPDVLPILSREKAATLNSHLHLKLASSGYISPTAWGALTELGDDFRWLDFGFASAQSFVEEVVMKSVQTKWQDNVVDMSSSISTPRRVQIAQIRVGAACDFAQKSDGPIPYVLATFIPARCDDPKKRPALIGKSASWISPLLDLGRWGRGYLFVEPRFMRTRGEDQTKALTAFARMREQLLIELIFTLSSHGARPGITQFEGEDGTVVLEKSQANVEIVGEKPVNSRLAAPH